MGVRGYTITLFFSLVNNKDYMTPFTGPVSIRRSKEGEEFHYFRTDLLPSSANFGRYYLDLLAEEFEPNVNYLFWIEGHGAADIFLCVKRSTTLLNNVYY